MTTDTNLEIRRYFDDLYKSANVDAKSQANIFVEGLNLNDLTRDQQVLKLHNEILHLKQKIDDFERKEYVNFAAFEIVIYKIFSARLLFFNVNEQALIKEGLYLSEKRNQLVRHYQEAKTQLPTFTFQDFLKSQKHVVFYELHQRPSGTVEEEYWIMRNWQAQKKSDCINLESKRFKERFIAKVAATGAITDEIKSETHRLEYLFKNAHQLTTEQFSTELSKIIALSPDSIQKNETEFHELFCKFIEGVSILETLTPKFLNSALKNIQTGIISQPPLCCWSFIKYDKWLNDLLDGKIKIEDINQQNYVQIFDNTFIDGVELSERMICDFKQKHPSDLIPIDEYINIILGELNKLRSEFNELAHPNYYHFLLDSETVKSFFVNNCSLDIDVEIHKEELRKAIVLNEMIVFFLEELYRIHNNPIDHTLDNLFLDLQITDLVTSMVPEPELIDQLLEAFSKTTSKTKHGRTPVLFIVEDLKDSLREIYNQAEGNLKQLFDKHPAEIKGHFAACQVRDMHHKELTAKRNGGDLHECFVDLKQLFQIELEFVQSLQSYNPINVNHLLKEPETQYKKKLSFGYKKSSDILDPIIHALNIKIDFLDNRTTEKDFIRIATSDDLESITEKIYIGCKTNEFKYTLTHFKSFFKSFNPAKIEQSDIFRSSNGNPFTADNLYNAVTDNLQTKIKIDNIFNQKQ